MSELTATTGESVPLELERDAVEYPEQRGEILLEAAHQWRQIGNHDRATELLEDVLGMPGVDADYARVCLAEQCFDRGADADAEAWAHLRQVESSGPTDSGPAGMVGELLAERGDHEAALCWFDLAIGLLSDERTALSTPGFPSLEAGLLHGRRDCREALGLPLDEIDGWADVQEQNRLDFLATLAGGVRRAKIQEFHVLVWRRGQMGAAVRRWPDVFASDTAGHHAAVEVRLRNLAAEQGTSKIMLVPGDVEDFASYLDRTGADPADEDTRLAYSRDAFARGSGMSWPPGRNEPCWCGSLRKYKKCCGAPQHR